MNNKYILLVPILSILPISAGTRSLPSIYSAWHEQATDQLYSRAFLKNILKTLKEIEWDNNNYVQNLELVRAQALAAVGTSNIPDATKEIALIIARGTAALLNFLDQDTSKKPTIWPDIAQQILDLDALRPYVSDGFKATIEDLVPQFEYDLCIAIARAPNITDYDKLWQLIQAIGKNTYKYTSKRQVTMRYSYQVLKACLLARVLTEPDGKLSPSIKKERAAADPLSTFLNQLETAENLSDFELQKQRVRIYIKGLPSKNKNSQELNALVTAIEYLQGFLKRLDNWQGPGQFSEVFDRQKTSVILSYIHPDILKKIKKYQVG